MIQDVLTRLQWYRLGVILGKLKNISQEDLLVYRKGNYFHLEYYSYYYESLEHEDPELLVSPGFKLDKTNRFSVPLDNLESNIEYLYTSSSVYLGRCKIRFHKRDKRLFRWFTWDTGKNTWILETSIIHNKKELEDNKFIFFNIPSIKVDPLYLI